MLPAQQARPRAGPTWQGPWVTWHLAGPCWPPPSICVASVAPGLIGLPPLHQPSLPHPHPRLGPGYTGIPFWPSEACNPGLTAVRMPGQLWLAKGEVTG